MNNADNWRRTLTWVSLVLVASVGAWAQEEKGSVYVTVELAGYGAPQIQVSDTQGPAQFLRLAPGQSSPEAVLVGYSSLEYPSIDVRIGRRATLEVQLSEAIGEVITVASESPLLDERRIHLDTTTC